MIRWIFVAALAIEVFLLVPPGHAPLFGWHVPAATVPTRLETEVQARGDALRRASFAARAARAEAELAPWLGANGPDVEVLARVGGRLVVDSERTAYAARLWAGLPARHPGARTILIPMDGTIPFGWRPAAAGGVCIAGWSQGWGKHPDHREELDRTSGLCALYSAYGPPGRTVQRWLARRPPRWLGLSDIMIRDSTSDAMLQPVVFEQSVMSTVSIGTFQTGWGFTTNVRSLDAAACAHGRLERCRSGYAIDDSMTVGISGFGSPIEPLGLMARHLPPEQFQAVWRTDRPLPEAFTQATGHAIEERLAAWTSGRFFSASRDTHSGTVLIGALLWLGLFGGWSALRFAAR